MNAMIRCHSVLDKYGTLQQHVQTVSWRVVLQVHDDLEPTDAGLMYSCFRSAQQHD